MSRKTETICTIILFILTVYPLGRSIYETLETSRDTQDSGDIFEKQKKDSKKETWLSSNSDTTKDQDIEERCKRYKRNTYKIKTTEGRLIFLGDSNILKIRQSYDTLESRNSETQHKPNLLLTETASVLNKLEVKISKINPKKLFIALGFKDIINGIPATAIRNQLYTFIDNIKDKNPSTAIYFVSTMPYTPYILSKSDQVAEVNKLNQYLDNIDNGTDINFIDLSGYQEQLLSLNDGIYKDPQLRQRREKMLKLLDVYFSY